MRRFALTFIGLALCLPAAAQQWEVGATGGYGSFRDRKLALEMIEIGTKLYEIDNGVRIGGRASFNFHEYFAHEASYAWQRGKLLTTIDYLDRPTFMAEESDISIHDLSYNFVAHATRRDARVRPFVTGGVGLSAFIFLPGSRSSRGENQLGYNYGGGIKFLASEEFGVRFDVRNHVTGKHFFPDTVSFRDTDGALHNLEISVTFSYLF